MTLDSLRRYRGTQGEPKSEHRNVLIEELHLNFRRNGILGPTRGLGRVLCTVCTMCVAAGMRPQLAKRLVRGALPVELQEDRPKKAFIEA